MGTSSTYGGPSSGLVPSWVDDADPGGGSGDAAPDTGDDSQTDPGQAGPDAGDASPDVSTSPATPGPVSLPNMSGPRGNFTRFTNSGNERALSRAVSGYLASTGGGRRAAQRMPSSTRLASGIAGFANSFATEGPARALQRFELQGMAGRPAVEVFDALADTLCPDGGTIDEGIARDAMLESIAVFATEDLGNFEDLTADHLQEFLAEVITRCIETKVINEIGTNSLHGSATDADFRGAEGILHDYTSQAVRDALSDVLNSAGAVDGAQMEVRIAGVFSDAFNILQSILEAL